MEDQKTVTKKPVYKCAICGKEYGTIKERMDCERTCFEKAEKEYAEVKRQKELQDKKELKDKLDQAIDEVYALYTEYYNKYHEIPNIFKSNLRTNLNPEKNSFTDQFGFPIWTLGNIASKFKY